MSFNPTHAIVWAELPVTDFDAAQNYYKALGFADFAVLEDGPNPIAIFQNQDPEKGVAGHLYPGKPAARGTGPTVHLAAPDTLEALASKVMEAGGKVVSPPVTIPAGQFIYTEDPDGNSVAFFRAN
ncbi:MAG: VOC family protein [Paracoccaceae bacterium]